MIESLVEAPALEIKMDEPVKSGARMEVSVSFGRFENDALSWEKFSSLSPNKYLEEVGNLSTLGSVAQKKAYFEAHYKKIAAVKAEEPEHEKSMAPPALEQDESSSGVQVENVGENTAEFGSRLNDEVSHEASRSVLTNVTFDNEEKDDNIGSVGGVDRDGCTNGLMNVSISEKKKEADARASFTVEEARYELNGNVNKWLEDSHQIAEKPRESKNGVEKSILMGKKNLKMNARDVAQKATPTKEVTNLAGSKKKVVSAGVKSSPAPGPKHVKPRSISMPVSTSSPLKKMANGSSAPKSSYLLVGKSKRVAAPTSLHMSLSLGPSISSSALNMSRKSLIMERMGDKDIVKRAFKTFQSRTVGYPADGKSTTLKQVSATASELNVSTTITPRNGNGSTRKGVEKKATQKSRSVPTAKPFLSGLYKSKSALDKKSTAAASPSIGLKSDERAEKHKEAKQISKEAENVQLSARAKEKKQPEIRNLRQSLSFKAKPMPSFYHGRGKGHSEKEEPNWYNNAAAVDIQKEDIRST